MPAKKRAEPAKTAATKKAAAKEPTPQLYPGDMVGVTNTPTPAQVETATESTPQEETP